MDSSSSAAVDRQKPEPPPDAAERRAAKPTVCYAVEGLPKFDHALYQEARKDLTLVSEVVVPPRDGRAFEVKAGQFFRIVSSEGPQVGDLNLYNAHDLTERFFSGKTRQLHATHVTTGDRLWSTLPNLRPMVTITHDTLEWYGYDEDGAGVHDVIGTRCDPHTNALLRGLNYDHCCHSNLLRGLLAARGGAGAGGASLAGAKSSASVACAAEAELLVHDVLNVFMCTGFKKDTHQYFMKASPVRPGDFIEFLAEIDLLGVLSACPGGDCGSSHSDDVTPCYPLIVQIYDPAPGALRGWQSPATSPYTGKHGL